MGWIKLHRTIKDHWIWQDATKLKWWLDLLLSVNHAPSKVLVGVDLVECVRGQSIRSLSSWANDWRVSKDTARHFFEALEKDGMISRESLGRTTRITVLNYDNYQAISTVDDAKTGEIILHENPHEIRTKSARLNYCASASCIEDSHELRTNAVRSLATNKKNKENKEDILSSDKSDVSQSADEKIDFSRIVEMYHRLCPDFPKVTKITPDRKNKMRLRFKEMDFDWETLEKVFKGMTSSAFLRGDSKSGWKASFDWVFCNGGNWVKIVEGNYKNNDRKECSNRNDVNSEWK